MATEVSLPSVDVSQKYAGTLQQVDNNSDNAETSDKLDDSSVLHQQLADDVETLPKSDSMNISRELNESQQAFLESCERDFAKRYTTDDPDYEKLVNEGIGEPPIVAPWYRKPRRNYDWSNRDRRNNAHRNEPYRHDYNRHRYESYQNRDEGDAGHSNNVYRNRYDRTNYRSAPYAHRRHY